ncbi:Protein of unknown function [Gryllus bimaculatus]|nr:Protein of unknown function [Gryllus bimaculatus]
MVYSWVRDSDGSENIQATRMNTVETSLGKLRHFKVGSTRMHAKNEFGRCAIQRRTAFKTVSSPRATEAVLVRSCLPEQRSHERCKAESEPVPGCRPRSPPQLQAPALHN